MPHNFLYNSLSRCTAPPTSSFLGIVSGNASDAGADEDDFHALKRRTNALEKEEASRERAEKLMRKRMTQTSITPASTLPHPDRQAFFTEAGTSPPQPAEVQKGSSAPAYLARGSVLPPRKTKVISF